MKFERLKNSVLYWAESKGIFEKATPQTQANKTLEEVTEMFNALSSGDKPELIDALGDILVTIIIQSEMHGLDIVDCLESAYNVISKRTGKMIKGQFVKDK